MGLGKQARILNESKRCWRGLILGNTPKETD
jgi:hypothetical protein